MLSEGRKFLANTVHREDGHDSWELTQPYDSRSHESALRNGMSNKASLNTTLDLLELALSWRSNGFKVAVATVIKTWGSSPRPPGSLLVIREDGLFEGSVSGGCIEGSVIQSALEVMRSHQPIVLEFGVSNQQAWQVGLACGGKIEVYVESIEASAQTFEQLQIDRAKNRSVARITNTHTGLTQLFYGQPSTHIEEQAEISLRSDRTQIIEDEDRHWLVQPFLPPLELLVIGAVHITQPLIQMAQLLGYKVTVIEPRAAFANQARFPEVDVIDEWPDDALNSLNLSSRCAVVTLTHDPKLDDPALEVALSSSCFYIGCLGSKKTHAARRQRLSEIGIPETELNRLNGPVGLPIGAKSPAEIAVSILAELTASLHVKETRPTGKL